MSWTGPEVRERYEFADTIGDIIEIVGTALAVEYIDVELSMPRNIIYTLRDRKGSSQIIASWHDTTGSMSWTGPEVRERYEFADTIGDIIEIVGTALAVEYIDVELSMPRNIIYTLRDRKGSSQIIASWHDTTGSMSWTGPEVRERYEFADTIGDIIEIVGTALAVEYIDVELSMPRNIIYTLRDRKGSSQIIASWHDTTGSMSWTGPEVRERYEFADTIGDIIEIVGTALAVEYIDVELSMPRNIIYTLRDRKGSSQIMHRGMIPQVA